MKLMLASESEWRRRLMGWLGVPFEVVMSGVDESLYQCDEVEELVAMLAVAKAEAVSREVLGGLDGELGNAKAQKDAKAQNIDSTEECLVIGADTVVVLDGEIIGKPKDREDARRIISSLQGRGHRVVTGVCVANSLTGEKRVEVESVEVVFAVMNSDEVEKYLKTEDWKGKAGAYQILRAITPYIEKVEGSVTSVIGLPLGLLTEMLNEMGMDVEVDLKQVIEREIGYGG